VNIYRERAYLVANLAARYPSYLACNDSDEPGWPVVYIHTPLGQMSWHISADDLDLFDHVLFAELDDPAVQWDGHTTEEKYERLQILTAALQTVDI
jgi:hypothetical protein